MKSVLRPSTKTTLIWFGLTGAATATHAGIQKKISGSGMTTLILSYEEKRNAMKIVKSLKESALLKFYLRNKWKWSKRTKNWIYWNVIRYIVFCMLLGALSLKDLLNGEGVKQSFLTYMNKE